MNQPARALSRRNLVIALAGGGALAAMAALLPAAEPLRRQGGRLPGGAGGRIGAPLAEAEMEDWYAQVGAVFQIAGGRSLRLAGVRALPSGGERPAAVARRRGFLAVFDVLGGLEMPDNLIHAAASRDHGPFELFLTVADAGTGPGQRMHAVFN